MAISKAKKSTIVDEVTSLLEDSRMTVVANYAGVNVSNMQILRRAAREQGVEVKVAKNRLVKLAAKNVKSLGDVDLGMLKGQVLIATSSSDEVAPAQVLANFAKSNPQLEFAGGFDASGQVFDPAQIKQLADLPSKDALRGQLVGTIAAPMTGFVSVMSGNLRGFINVLNARKEAIS